MATEVTGVFPARAGMSRSGLMPSARRSAFPRVSGDEPHPMDEVSLIAAFSPRERG